MDTTLALARMLSDGGLALNRGDASQKNPGLLVSALPLHVLAIENALRALLHRQNTPPPTTTDLMDLYDALEPEPRRTVIETGQAANIRIQGVIQEHRHTLDEMRAGGIPTFMEEPLIKTVQVLVQTYQRLYGQTVQHPPATHPTQEAEAKARDSLRRYAKRVFVRPELAK